MQTRRKRLILLAMCSLTMATSGYADIIITPYGNGTGYDDNTPAYRSTSVVKPADPDGDNVYGTAGYLMFGTAALGTGGTTQGPAHHSQGWGTFYDHTHAWVTVNEGADFRNIADGFAGYAAIDDPNAATAPNVADWARRSGIATAVSDDVDAWREIVTFDIGADTPAAFRLGVMAGNPGPDHDRWDPKGIRLSSGAAVATVTGLPETTGLGWVFFDVDIGGATSGTFSIELQQRHASFGGSIGGFTFDVIPEPSTLALLIGGMAMLMLHRRRKA